MNKLFIIISLNSISYIVLSFLITLILFIVDKQVYIRITINIHSTVYGVTGKPEVPGYTADDNMNITVTEKLVLHCRMQLIMMYRVIDLPPSTVGL